MTLKANYFMQPQDIGATLGDVFVIDPTGVGHCYNPLFEKKTEDDLLSAASHLLYQADEGEGRIFTQRATVMLAQLFAAARLEGVAALSLCTPYHSFRTICLCSSGSMRFHLNLPHAFLMWSTKIQTSQTVFYSQHGERSPPGCSRF